MAAIRKSTAENTDVDLNAEPMSIPKPRAFSMAAFKTKSAPTIAGVETLLAALPHHKISEAKDWVRLHPDETKYWSDELCFVNVPIDKPKPMPKPPAKLLTKDEARRIAANVAKLPVLLGRKR